MVLTNQARNDIRDAVNVLFTHGGLGIDTTTEARTDTELFGGGTTIDACDASPSTWVASGQASAATLITSTGFFQEGTGCFTLPTSGTGTATWSKTISTIDVDTDKVYFWFYIDNFTIKFSYGRWISCCSRDSSWNILWKF